jgi:hypothetical protein
MKKFDKIIPYYFLSTIGMNTMYKTCELWDAKVERKSGKYTDMLLGEKLGILVLTNLWAPLLFPTKIFKTLDNIDLYFRGDCPEDFDIDMKPKSFSSYLYS